MKEKELEYFSDDELEALIQEIEENEMHKAPLYLKKEIMKKAFPSKEGRGNSMAGFSMRKRKKLIFYTCKVGVATAAAILLLFTIPVSPSGMVYEGEENIFTQVTSRMDEKSDEICNKLSDISNKIIINKNNESEE